MRLESSQQAVGEMTKTLEAMTGALPNNASPTRSTMAVSSLLVCKKPS